jgi:hypothetical protein
MQTSEQINELIEALAQAQGEFKPVSKSAENPFLRNKYATLDGVIDVIRGPLSKHGLAFVQPLTTAEGSCWLETRIMHRSGQWIATAAEIPEFNGSKGVNSLQSFGGALTYMRRYMLTSMLGINSEDDTDGNEGKENGHKPQVKSASAPPPPDAHWIEDTQSRKRFWVWAKQDRGLTEDQVHEALGVASLKEYMGTKGDAMTALNDYVDAQLAIEAGEAADE